VFDPPEDNPVQKFSRSVVPHGKRVKDQTFAFDRIFDQNASQGEVYESTTRGLLDSVLDGYNATVFAYGATGCGKTHTITGTAQQPGIIFMTMQELFERIDERSGEKSTEISLSYLEIYNETIRDLLVPGTPKGGLMLREDVNQSVSVAGLSSHHPQNVEQVMDMIVPLPLDRTPFSRSTSPRRIEMRDKTNLTPWRPSVLSTWLEVNEPVLPRTGASDCSRVPTSTSPCWPLEVASTPSATPESATTSPTETRSSLDS
jgi:hypothetical protein